MYRMIVHASGCVLLVCSMSDVALVFDTDVCVRRFREFTSVVNTCVRVVSVHLVCVAVCFIAIPAYMTS